MTFPNAYIFSYDCKQENNQPHKFHELSQTYFVSYFLLFNEYWFLNSYSSMLIVSLMSSRMAKHRIVSFYLTIF
jgi:hypothetical protein